jgi:predicted lipoprotein with Yx(FWY)xxD motif
MIRRSRTAGIVITLAGLAGAAACGQQVAAAGAIVAPVVAARTAEVPQPAQGPGDQGGAGAASPASSDPVPSDTRVAPEPIPTTSARAAATGASDEPVPVPTVAKVQKWVKIFSGPSATDLKPPKSRKGSHTVELNVTTSADIGAHVSDGAGRTLYRFDNDSADPPKSTCNGDCATAWPPLLIKSPGKIFPKGVNPKIIGYVERADHTCQVTIAGHPVYYFVADARPGDINGQGVNGKWFAVDPRGDKTTARPLFLPPGGKTGK